MRSLAASRPPERRTAVAKGAAQVFLEHEQRGRGARLHHAAGLVDVLLGKEARRSALKDGQLGDLASNLGDLKPADSSVLILGDKDEVKDADQASVDEVD